MKEQTLSISGILVLVMRDITQTALTATMYLILYLGNFNENSRRSGILRFLSYVKC